MRRPVIALLLLSALVSCGRTELVRRSPVRPFPIDISGGVNMLRDPRRIAQNEVAVAQNLVPVDPGVYRTRGALSFVQRTVTPSVGGVLSKVLDAMLHPIPAASGDFVATSLPVTTGSTFVFFGAFDAIFSFQLNLRNFRPWMTSLGGKVYILGGPGDSAAARLVQYAPFGPPDMETVDFAFAGTGNGAVRPKLVTGYRSRYVWANFGPGFENSVIFSNNFLPDTIGNDALATDGRNISLVSTYDGDEIVGLAEVMLSSVGSPAQAGLLVLRQRSAFLLTGEPDQAPAATLGTLVVNRLAVNAGCVSPWTIVKTPYGTIWASEDDIWLMDVGSIPRPIGIKIRKALKQSPPNLLYRWTATYFDGFYRLAIHSEGQGPTEESPLGEQWWLDLRDGAPRSHADARWWGPMKFFNAVKDADAVQGTRNFMQEGRPNQPAGLYGLEEGIGPTAGATTFNLVQYDTPLTRDSNLDTSASSTAVISDELGDEIQIDLITREFDFNEYDGFSASREKIYDGLEASIWNSNPGRLIVDAIINGGESTSSVNLDMYNAGFEAGVDQLDAGTSMVARVPQAVAAHPQPRPVGVTYQFRIRNQPGYLVTDENDTLTFRLDNGVTTSIIQVVVPQSLYLFIDGSNSYRNAFKTAIDAATGLSWTVEYSHTTGLFTFQLPAGPHSIDVPLVGDIFPGLVTDDQMLENRRILAMLGMATANDIEDVVGVTSESPIYQKNNSMWEFSSLDALMEVLPRRP